MYYYICYTFPDEKKSDEASDPAGRGHLIGVGHRHPPPLHRLQENFTLHSLRVQEV